MPLPCTDLTRIAVNNARSRARKYRQDWPIMLHSGRIVIATTNGAENHTSGPHVQRIICQRFAAWYREWRDYDAAFGAVRSARKYGALPLPG